MSSRRGGVAAPSLIAGMAMAFSLPPWGWWPVAFAGSALLFWRLGGLRARARLLSGWTAGLGCYVPGLFWTHQFNDYGAAVLMIVEALFMSVAAALVPPHRARVSAFAASFTVLEAARMTWPFGGLPIGGVFLGQAGGPLLGTARLGGPLLMTALVYAGGAGLAGIVATVRTVSGARWASGPDAAPGPGAGAGAPAGIGTRATLKAAARANVAGLVAVGVVVVVGVAGAVAPDGGAAAARIKVAAVQGGGRRGLDMEQVATSTVFNAQLAASYPLAGVNRSSGGSATGSAGGGRLALVVWPEDVISLGAPPLRGSFEADTMSALARQLHATIAAGVTITVSDSAFDNEVVAWSPKGRIVGTFEKVHRVPFGEYVPYRAFFSHLANLSRVPYDAVPGHGSGLLETPAAPLGVLVSYEVFFADRGRSSVRAGAQLLVVPTNTSSYVSSQVPTQEVAAAQVQAVEEGRDLIQASPTGYSAVIDNHGDVLQRSVLGKRQVLLAKVSLRRGDTVYEELGDFPVLLLGLLVLLSGWGLVFARDGLPGRRRVTGGDGDEDEDEPVGGKVPVRSEASMPNEGLVGDAGVPAAQP